MIRESKKQLSFADMQSNSRVSEKNVLMKIDYQIDWRPFEVELEKLYCKDNGRPGYPPVAMFKGLLLQQWYNLSDPELEEAILDRLSFQRFMGLSLDESVPDETTLNRFRNKLSDMGVSKKLFDLLGKQLENKGLIVKKGTLIDASLMEAARRRPKKGEEGKDTDASYTVKRKKPHYGYKAHVGVDQRSGLVRKIKVTGANIHDSDVFDDMLSGDEQSAFADKAYCKQKRKRQMRKDGIYCGILDKGYRNRPLSNKQKRRNGKHTRIRNSVERVFAIMKRHYGMNRVRYVGLDRNQSHMYLLSMAINMKRMLTLEAAT